MLWYDTVTCALVLHCNVRSGMPLRPDCHVTRCNISKSIHNTVLYVNTKSLLYPLSMQHTFVGTEHSSSARTFWTETGCIYNCIIGMQIHLQKSLDFHLPIFYWNFRETFGYSCGCCSDSERMTFVQIQVISSMCKTI